MENNISTNTAKYYILIKKSMLSQMFMQFYQIKRTSVFTENDSPIWCSTSCLFSQIVEYVHTWNFFFFALCYKRICKLSAACLGKNNLPTTRAAFERCSCSCAAVASPHPISCDADRVCVKLWWHGGVGARLLPFPLAPTRVLFLPQCSTSISWKKTPSFINASGASLGR